MASTVLRSVSLAGLLALVAPGHVLASPCISDPPEVGSSESAEPFVFAPYQALPEDTRRRLQWALVWAGHYSGEVDGIIGPLTLEALKAFQESVGGYPSAHLTEREEETLLQKAVSREKAAGFKEIEDERAGFPIALPTALTPFFNPATHGSRYRSRDGEVDIETLRLTDGRSLCELYQRITGLSGRVVTYSLVRANSFVAMGQDGRRAFFMQAIEDAVEDGAPEIRAVAISYPERLRLQMHPIVVAIWNTFRPFDVLEYQIGLEPFYDDVATGSIPSSVGGAFLSLDPRNDRVAVLNGPIKWNAHLEFRQFAQKHPRVKHLRLNSPGGLAWPALEIAKEARARRYGTHVPEGGQCFSACAYIFIAGEMRTVSGQLGVHQIRSATDGLYSLEDAQLAISQVIESLNRSRIDPEVYAIMLRTPPSDMHIFSDDELKLYSLVTNKGIFSRRPDRSFPPSHTEPGSPASLIDGVTQAGPRS